MSRTVWLWIALGGALGSVLRYALSGWVQGGRWGDLWGFPWGTLFVNLTGCLVLGFLAGLFQERFLVGPELRAMILIGLLGGYTTFSTFGVETFNLIKEGSFHLALLNGLGSPVLGILGAWLGDLLAHWL